MELTTRYYGEALDLPPATVRERLSKEVGYVTPKVGADAAIFNDTGEILLVLRADDQQVRVQVRCMHQLLRGEVADHVNQAADARGVY